LERARGIFVDHEEADRLLVAGRAGPTLAVAVTAPVLFGQQHVAPAIVEFLQRHLKLRVQLMLVDRIVNLVEEGLDIGVRIDHLQNSTLIAQPVCRIRRTVVGSPAVLKRHGVPSHPREVAKAPWLRFNTAQGGSWAFRDNGRAAKVAVRGPFECSIGTPMLQARAEGLGFGRCLSYRAVEWLRGKRLSVVLVAYTVAPWPVHISHPSARLLPLRTRVFGKAMKKAPGRQLEQLPTGSGRA
jgi:DNA-binding transcriptional LysR family regulator